MPATEQWVSLLLQVPLIGVFIWYTLQRDARQAEVQREFLAALEKRDDAFEKRNAATIQAIERLNDSIAAQLREMQCGAEEHDRWVRENVNRTRSAKG